MTRNTTLTAAVLLALVSAGAATAQDTQQCNSEATQLKAQIDASALSDPDRAKLEDSLSEAQTADVARCEQIVARISRELKAGGDTGATNPDTGEDYASRNSSNAQPGDESAADPSAYEQGHAAAAESLPEHPGAAANSTDPASTTMQDEGYASAQATMSESQSTSDSATAATTGSTTSSTATKGGTATSALSSMTADELVDKPVKATDGKEIGEIDKIVIDRTPQGHGFAVIGVGGLLGVGETKVLVDLDQLQLTADGSLSVPVASKEDVEALPRYDEAHYQQYQGELGRLL